MSRIGKSDIEPCKTGKSNKILEIKVTDILKDRLSPTKVFLEINFWNVIRLR